MLACRRPHDKSSAARRQHETVPSADMDASSTGSPSAGRPSRPSRPRRAPRIRIACARCHRRKIRCDAAMPACGACQKAGVSCVYDTQFADGRQQRLADEDLAARNSELEGRVEWLESLLQQQGTPTRTLRGGLSPQSLERPEASGLDDGAATVGAVDELAQIAVEPQGRAGAAIGEHQAQPPSADGTGSPQRRVDSSSTHGTLSHEVGLVSLSTGADPKYVGPSSGYFFTRLLGSGSNTREPNVHVTSDDDASSRRQNAHSLALEICQDAEQPLPGTERKALQLSETYFSTIHVQYPFLHEPRYRQLVQEVYQSTTPSRIAYFQVTMVIAISAIILSRRSGVGLPASGWCAAAMAKFSDAQLENSLEGLQALLLMSIYAMHSPSSPFNAWYINYQCIAMVLDLGLQRDVRAAGSMSKLRREMRTRIFWVVYTLDRKLCTMMGRPIGIRDEACDLRIPADIDDQTLDSDASSLPVAGPAAPGSPVTHMSYAIHLFELAKINSEIKYVLHSIRRDTPSYAFPAIRDIGQWQEKALRRLESLRAQVPRSTEPRLEHAYHFCDMQHDAVKLLLLLPSPGIPRPGPERLRDCYETAVGAIKLFNRLDAQDILIHSWSTCHALILYSFCALYCVAAIPQSTLNADRDSLAKDLRAALSLLSGIGENWAGAKRTRHLLNELISVVLDTAPAEGRSAAGPKAQMSGQQSQYPISAEGQRSLNISCGNQTQGFPPRAAGATAGGTQTDNIAFGARLETDVFDTNYFDLFGNDLFSGSSDLWNMFSDVLGPSESMPNDIGMDWEKIFDP